jgi:monovalent cation:H+ antiporter-2, CPA2 family
MLLDPSFLLENLTTVLIIVVLVAVGKSVIFGLLSWLFHYVNVVPMAIALTMFQIGEFSFLLARVGLATDSISQELYSLVLVTAVVTMIFTPLAAQVVEPLYRVYRKRFPLSMAMPAIHWCLRQRGSRMRISCSSPRPPSV